MIIEHVIDTLLLNLQFAKLRLLISNYCNKFEHNIIMHIEREHNNK